jgi:hypothetical protein
MGGNFKMDDYVDVAERIRQFKELYPDGSLQTLDVEWTDGLVIVKAAAYRTPDDERPGIGMASEPVPGKTPYTRDSELMNAETSAWGRAIVAVGIPTKRIASSDEVRNRQATRDEQAERAPAPAGNREPAQAGNGKITKTQARTLHEMLYAKGRESSWFLRVLKEKKGIGDGEHLTSIPSEHYESLLKIVVEFADPEPPRRDPEPEDDLDEADRQFLEDTDRRPSDEHPEWGEPRKKGSVTAPQLTRLGALCQDLEELGVGRDEWRLEMWEKEKVASRTELTKTAATRVIGRLQKWVTDLRSVGERVA